jgi:CRISPR-associated protein Csm1
MSLQVFLQAQLLGAEEFLAARSSGHSEPVADLIGRCAWLSLFCEVLPRALLSELKLSRMLLGSSSAEQFLLVLAEEDIARADEFLGRAADAVVKISGDTLRLVWASTENLGAWPVARKRLDDALLAKNSAPLAANANPNFFAPLGQLPELDRDLYFNEFAQKLPLASRVGWSADRPAHLTWDEGQYTWRLEEQSSADGEAILFLRRFAMDETGSHPSSLAELAERAEGAPRWGVLRGDVDHFDFRLRRAGSIEEHIHLSVLFKEFFAGELALLCTLGDFWRKVSILYRGGDDFALIGTWDALVMLAREVERLFEKFVQQNFESFPSLEGKTISMALAIAPDFETSATAMFEQAGVQLRAAKATEAGSFHLFGRTLEWKRLGDAEELKTGLVRLVRDFGYSPAYINDLAAVYREAFSARASRSSKAIRVDKPWRTYMRLSRVIPQARSKELNNIRSTVITNLVGKKTAGFKLRPSARVGLEWARLAASA